MCQFLKTLHASFDRLVVDIESKNDQIILANQYWAHISYCKTYLNLFQMRACRTSIMGFVDRREHVFDPRFVLSILVAQHRAYLRRRYIESLSRQLEDVPSRSSSLTFSFHKGNNDALWRSRSWLHSARQTSKHNFHIHSAHKISRTKIYDVDKRDKYCCTKEQTIDPRIYEGYHDEYLRKTFLISRDIVRKSPLDDF